MNGNDGIGATGRGRRHGSWQMNALLALGGWLVVSPLVLSTTQVTAGVVSAVTTGLALAVLAGLARRAGNPIPPLMIALAFGLWLVLAPLLWEFGYGRDSWELVPIVPWLATEPTQAAIVRAELNALLAGLLTLALAGSALVAARRRSPRPGPSTGTDHPRHVEVTGEER
jgi:MFS-type transporter involved in bile tolerance (Atg22 family)